MAEQGADQRWIGLAVGLGVAGVIGLIGLLYFLIRRRDGDSTPSVYMLNAPSAPMPGNAFAPIPQPQFRFDMGRDQQPITSMLPPPAFLNESDESMMSQQPIMHTYALANLAQPGTPTRLAQASNTSYDVTLSVVGPEGSYAAFAMEPGELMNPDVPIPTGNTFILPTCKERTIRLLPHQTIYAKGVAPTLGETVYATATAHEVGTRVYGDMRAQR
jgi:hypothetical protein